MTNTPRRGIPQEPASHGRRNLMIGAGAGLVAMVGGGVAVHQATASGSHQAVSPGACGNAAVIAVDPAWMSTMQHALDVWSRGRGVGCSPVALRALDSATAATGGIGGADAWVPEDPAWVPEAKPNELQGSKPTDLGGSPLVIAMESAPWKALGGNLTGDKLRLLMAHAKKWKDYGHPEWGWFRVCLPDVPTTVSGAVGFGSLIASTGRGATPPSNLVTATQDQVNLTYVQQALFGNPPVDKVLDNLGVHKEDETGQSAPSPRAGVVPVHLLLQHGGDLAAAWLAPAVGIRMALANVTDNPTINEFATWLGSDAGQKELASKGVTAGKHAPSKDDLAKFQLGSPPTVAPAQAGDVTKARVLLTALKRRTVVYLALDTSGSMADPLGIMPGRRIDSVMKLLTTTWDHFQVGQPLGLITFNAGGKDGVTPIITKVAPIHDDLTPAGFQFRTKIRKAMAKGLPVGGGTPLYQAIVTSYKWALEEYREGHTNRLVLMTDGANEDSSSTITIEQCIADLKKMQSTERPVVLMLVGMGPDADMAALNRIAKETNNEAAMVVSPQDLANKVALAISD